MITLNQTKQEIEREPQQLRVHLMNFVDDFRYYKDLGAMVKPIELTNPNWMAYLHQLPSTYATS